jgi:hypothetical protein
MAQDEISAQDRLDILDLLGRYFFAVDSGDAEGVVASFAPGGAVRYDSGERYEGADGLRRFAAKAIGGAETCGRMHLNFPLFFRRDGEAVILSSYLGAAHWRPPTPPQAFGSLRYIEDRCVTIDGAWRILERSISLWNSETVQRRRERAGATSKS